MPQPQAILINLRNGDLKLPTFFLTAADEKDGKNAQKVTLGAKCDQGVIGRAQPSIELNAYSYKKLSTHPVLRAMAQRRDIDFRAPSLGI